MCFPVVTSKARKLSEPLKVKSFNGSSSDDGEIYVFSPIDCADSDEKIRFKHIDRNKHYTYIIKVFYKSNTIISTLAFALDI